MCGISGIVGFGDGFAVSEEIVRAMSDTMVHRGPDASGALHRPAERVALGHRRLSIVDLSEAGRQPMCNEDGTVWITYNGEVYNHAALRAELEAKGHVYRSHTDTETILHLYEEEGPRCVERLHGMFAFAIWDARRRELLLARDRVGVKPLYYARLPGGLLFASEIKGLLAHPALSPELDEEALFHYLTFAFAPAPLTLYRDVRKLAPAERIVVRADGSLHAETWWTPFDGETAREVAQMSEPEMEQRVLDLLRASIGKRMMSDVPFGVFLSGGLDSSTNVALMSELTSEPVRTFSTAPKGHPKYDELAPARLVAERFGTDHHEVLVDETDLAAFVPQLIELQDEPLSDWTCVPQHFVSKLARDNGTPVVQVGEGADELFHGYKGYADHRRFFVPFQRAPRPLQRLTARAGLQVSERTGRGMRHAEALYDAAHSPLPYWGGSICWRGQLKDELLGPTLARRESSLKLIEPLWEEAGRAGADLFQRMTYVELKQRLAELLLQRLDRIAMLSSVEGREPFLDHELVELALALPPRMKHRDGTGKYVLRRAVRDLLPAEILNRPKQGFGTPMAEWLRGDFGVRAEATVARSSLVERGAISVEPIQRLFAAHRSGRMDWSYHLWNVYNACAWHDRWVAGQPVA
ncbi:MAG TPA: asparagine synthase (glutamine-hydrolyzing) [Conexibacter sp.]|nr:asparagine synthase (glutamine-hydrolyzing) [Conexibacter sp.]